MPTCTICGTATATKGQTTHHRRGCRTRLAERLAAAVDTPLGLALSGRAPGGRGAVSLARVGPAFTVITPDRDYSFPTAAEAAADFINRLRPTD